MSLPAEKTRLYTFEDFCDLIGNGQKADLIDGVIYMASPENLEANDLVGWLYTLLRLFVRKTGIGRVFFSRVAFQLDDSNGPEPDIGFVLKRRLHVLTRGRVKGRPDTAMEVVSPDSIERDYQTKRRQYEQAKVPEYWIIDEILEKVLLLRLGADGKYREIRPVQGKLRSQVIKGFWIRPEWLWAKPLPDELETLKTILASK